MTRKPLSPEAMALNEVIRKACERMERRLKREEGDDVLTLTGVLKELDEQPREA